MDHRVAVYLENTARTHGSCFRTTDENHDYSFCGRARGPSLFAREVDKAAVLPGSRSHASSAAMLTPALGT
eukprot:5990286-Amphidinium_carterae.1